MAAEEGAGGAPPPKRQRQSGFSKVPNWHGRVRKEWTKLVATLGKRALIKSICTSIPRPGGKGNYSMKYLVGEKNCIGGGGFLQVYQIGLPAESRRHAA